MEIISRSEAHAAGNQKFYTGRPCKRGHLTQRYTSTGGCIACQNWKVMPTAAAHNVGMPPSPYAFHTDVHVTPAMVSYVHARVLRDAIHGYAREFAVLRPACPVPDNAPPVSIANAVLAKLDKLRTLVPLKGADFDKMRAAGWTDAQLLAEGFAEWEYPRL